MLASVQQHFSNVEYKIILILIFQNKLTEQQTGWETCSNLLFLLLQ